MDTALIPAEPTPAPTSTVLPQALQEGFAVLAKLAAKWPSENQHVSQNAPLWKDGLAIMDAGWAEFAAQSVGWLDQSSTALVVAGKEMSGQDPMLAYSQLGAKLEKLLNEVTQPNQRNGFLDNWHVLRKPANEPASVRLEKIVQEKSELDQVAGSRMRGLRDAMEMRDLSREALAILSNAGAPLRLHMHEALEKETNAADPNKPSSPLSLQKAERAQRQFRRATSALDIIQERLGHEFSGSSADLSSLDEAVHQEELMHSRIDGLTSKIAATIAGEGLKQLAHDQAEHSKAIAVAPEPEASPLQALMAKHAEPRAQSGFLSRLFSRVPMGSKVSKESARILRDMSKYSGEADFSKTLSEIRKGPNADEFWENIIKLMSDEEVSPTHKVGQKTLLSIMSEMATAPEVSNARFDFESKLALITMFSTRHPDGPKELQSIAPERFAHLFARAILGSDETGAPSDGVHIAKHRTNMQTVASGFSLLEARGALAGGDHFNKFGIVTKFLRNTPQNYITPQVREKAVQIMEGFIMSTSPPNFGNENVEAIDAILPHLSVEAASKFGYAKLSRKVKNSKPPTPEDIKLISRLAPMAVNDLAGELMSTREKGEAPWTKALLNANKRLLPSEPVVSDKRSYVQADNSFTPYLPLDHERPQGRADMVNLLVLSQYSDMMFSGKKMKQWPEELRLRAFTSKDITLLNDLAQGQPQAAINLSATTRADKVLASIIAADMHSGDRDHPSAPGATSTDPDYWCRVLSKYIDGKTPASYEVKSIKTKDYFEEDDDQWGDAEDEDYDVVFPPDARPEMPRMTPLMVACKYNSTPWIKALLKAGADPDVKDHSGLRAVGHWCQGAMERARKESVESTFTGKHGRSHAVVNPAKTLEIYAKNIVTQMDEVGYWNLDIASKAGNCGTLLLQEALYLSLNPPVHSDATARKVAVEIFLADMSRHNFINAVSGMISPPGRYPPGDPSIDKALAYGRRAGLFSPEETQDISESIHEQSKVRAFHEQNKALLQDNMALAKMEMEVRQKKEEEVRMMMRKRIRRM